LWVSAQPVSRFAPPEAWATVHAEPHAPRESQHLRLLNLRVYDRKVNLARARHSLTLGVSPNATRLFSTHLSGHLSVSVYPRWAYSSSHQRRMCCARASAPAVTDWSVAAWRMSALTAASVSCQENPPSLAARTNSAIASRSPGVARPVLRTIDSACASRSSPMRTSSAARGTSRDLRGRLGRRGELTSGVPILEQRIDQTRHGRPASA